MFPGILFFTLTSFLASLCTNATELIIVRVLQASAAAAIMVTIPAMIRDLFSKEAVAKALSSIIMVMTIAPLVAPILGGQILQFFSWQSLFIVLGATSGLSMVLAIFRVRETLKEPDRLMIPPSKLALNYITILSQREAIGCILCHAFFFGGMFAFITGSPFVYIELFGIPAEDYGLLFAVNILSMILTNMINIRLVDRFALPVILRMGSLLAAGASLILWLNAFTGNGGLAGLMIPIALYIACIGFTGPNSNAVALSYFPNSAGSANALAGALRFTIAAIASALVGYLHDGTAMPMATVMAGCGLLSVVAFRWSGCTKNNKESICC